MLIDANHAAVINTTGSAITVTQATVGQGTGAGVGDHRSECIRKCATFTVSLNNGNNKTATTTATIVVNGVTYTVNCAVSS